MTVATVSRPVEGEFLPYYEKYITLVPDGDVVSLLEEQMLDTQSLLRGLPAAVSTYRYAPGKWSVNELLGHVIDSERIFAARALRFARNDPLRCRLRAGRLCAELNFDDTRSPSCVRVESVRRANVFSSNTRRAGLDPSRSCQQCRGFVRALA